MSQVNRWKKEAIKMLPDLFRNKVGRTSKENEKEEDRLYQQIGELQVEVNFLKKTGILL